jgi:hypothetical protein
VDVAAKVAVAELEVVSRVQEADLVSTRKRKTTFTAKRLALHALVT